jgi:predicted transcriptional regulator
MAAQRANDLRAFRQYIDERLTNGGSEMTLDEALANWEVENQTDEEREETLQAIREGLADVGAGRTRPAEAVIRDLCRKDNIPDPTPSHDDV